jgi:hypothetical protein
MLGPGLKFAAILLAQMIVYKTFHSVASSRSRDSGPCASWLPKFLIHMSSFEHVRTLFPWLFWINSSIRLDPTCDNGDTGRIFPSRHHCTTLLFEHCLDSGTIHASPIVVYASYLNGRRIYLFRLSLFLSSCVLPLSQVMSCHLSLLAVCIK